MTRPPWMKGESCEARLTVICLSRHQIRNLGKTAVSRWRPPTMWDAMTASSPALLAALHGTRSAAGLATARALISLVAAARPDLDVDLAFLDVASPSLAERLGATTGPVVIVPVLLSAGYHV